MGVPERSGVTKGLGRAVTNECHVPVAPEACRAPTPR